MLLNLFLSSVAAMITLSQMIQHFLTVGFQQWISATVVDMKSPSFVCLTSEVRALFVASCFEVCSQLYGQCSFCCPWASLSEIVPNQIIWLDHLASGPCSALFSLSLSRQNKQPRIEAEPDFERSDKLTVLYSPGRYQTVVENQSSMFSL